MPLLLGCAAHGGAPDGGADGGASPLPSPALSPAAACAELSQALGALEVRCGRLAAQDEAAWAKALCAGATAHEEAAFDAGLLAYSASAVACETAFRGSQPCNLAPDAPSGCGPLAWGSLAQGDRCDDPLTCGLGLFCERLSGDAPCGLCTTEPGIGGPCGPSAYGAPCQQGICDGTSCDQPSTLGQPCYVTAAACTVGLTCQQGDCLPPAPDGGVCGGAADCADGLYCQGGNCAPRADAGAPCSAGGCAAGLGCGLTPDGGSLCEPFVPGGPCVLGQDGGMCLEAEWCGPDGGCLPMPGLGGACVNGAPCLAGGCVAGLCSLLGAGEICTGGAACENGRCGGSGEYPVCEPNCGS